MRKSLNHTKISSSQGFTLAEILFAITIIGVIAALTIPDLILNAQKQNYVSGFRTATRFSVLQRNK